MTLLYANLEGSNSTRLSQLFKFRKKKVCLFLDADGVLWEDQGPGTILKYPEICSQARDLIEKFSEQKDHLTIVITNQTSAARNLISLQALQELIIDIFKRSQNKVKINAVYSCFHHPKAENLELRNNCTCRKPSPEMIFQASRKFNIDLSRSFLIGDRITDMQSANLAGVGQSFLLVNSKMYEVNTQNDLLKNEEKLSSTFLPIANLSEVNQFVFSKKKPWRRDQ